jgi:hypothetical protein
MNEAEQAPPNGTARNLFRSAALPQADHSKKVILLTALAWAFFSTGVFFRYFLIPNQILITAAGTLLFVFGPLVFIRKENLQGSSDVPKLWHKIEYGLTALFFWGYFQGWESEIGLWPAVFYAALALVTLYFAAILWKANVIGERRRQFRNLGSASSPPGQHSSRDSNPSACTATLK